MQIDFERIKNKQRIFIGGNDGTEEILQIICHTLNKINKPYALPDSKEGELNDSPIFLYTGMDHLSPSTQKAGFHDLRPHIALLHKIKEPTPPSYHSFEEYINQYEILADQLPKAGTLIYYQSDNVSMIVGKKERDDLNNIEYAKVKNDIRQDRIVLKFDSGEVTIKSDNHAIIGEISAAFTLLKRLGVKEEQFTESLNTLNISV